METKDFQETISYLQEDDNYAIIDWQSFLADVMAVVLNTDMENKEQLLMLGSLSNLRSIIGKLKSHGK